MVQDTMPRKRSVLPPIPHSLEIQDVELSLGGKSSGGVVLWDMGGMMRCGDVRMVKVGVRRGQNIIRGVRG